MLQAKTYGVKKLVLLLALSWMGCNNASKENNTTADTSGQKAAPQTAITEPQTSTLQAGCYRAVQNRDTILLQLEINGNIVTGQMQYDNFEIDGNVGTINGVLQGGRISGVFTYASEGMWSVREIVFEVRNGQLLQADTRNMKLDKDTLRFANPDSLVFDAQRPFSSVRCTEVQFDTLPPQNP